MKTFIRYTNSKREEVVVKTVPEDTDTGITHSLYFPIEMKIGETIECGFGWTESEGELHKLPVIALYGGENHEEYLFEAMCRCVNRMSLVVATLLGDSGADIKEFTEIDIYMQTIKLIEDYFRSMKDCPVFIKFNGATDALTYGFKLLWEGIPHSDITAAILPRDIEMYDVIKSYDGYVLVEKRDVFKWTVGMKSAETLEESRFMMLLEFTQSEVTMAHVFHAFSLMIEKGLEMAKDNTVRKDVALYTSLNFTQVYIVFMDLLKNNKEV